MNMEAFEYFIKVSDIKSISKVSQQAHISQSALSQIIHKFEDSVGHQLFLRSNKGVELTQMGKVVYQYAEIVLKTVQKMKDDLDCMAKNKCNVVINSTWAIADYSLPPLLMEISNKHPEYHYELISNRSESIIENVENGLCDFGVIYGESSSSKLINIPFGEDKIVLVSSKDYPVPDSIHADELFNYELINFKHGCYYTDVKNSIRRTIHNPYDFKPLLILDSISAVKSTLSEGFGLAFLPYSAVKKECLGDRFKITSIQDIDLSLKVSIISLPKEQLNANVLSVINLFTCLGSTH